MEKIIDKKDLQSILKLLKNPTYYKGFIVAMMKDEDYKKLKDLYTELNDKEQEIEKNLENIIRCSKKEEYGNTPEERIQKNSEALGELFGSLLDMFLGTSSTPTLSLKDYENRVPVLLRERKSIIGQINTLYDSYREEYDKEINSEETKNMFLVAFGNRKGDIEGEFIEWIMRLQK